MFKRATLDKSIGRDRLEYVAGMDLLSNPFLAAERWQKFNKMQRREAAQFDPFASYKKDPFYYM